MILNGERVEYREGITVTGLLASLNLVPDKVVVEVDREIISKDEYGLTKLNSDSEVELIRFVGGG